MSAVLLALLLAQSTTPVINLPPDAPVVDRQAWAAKKGDVMPVAGVCMDDRKAVQTGKRIAACEASLTKAETFTMVSTPVLVGGVVAVVAIVAAAFGAGYAAGKVR